MSYEYKAIDLRDNDLLPGITECHPEYRALGNVDVVNLNRLGAEGWELVTVYQSIAYFKRSINRAPQSSVALDFEKFYG